MSDLQPLPEHDDSSAAEISKHWVLPTATSPAIRADRVRDHTRPVPVFADELWGLDALGRAPGARTVTVHWKDNPASGGKGVSDEFREPFRLAAYILINEGTHRSVVDRRWSSSTKWLAPSTLHAVVREWAVFGRWLTADGILALADVDTDTLEAFQRHVQSLNRRPEGKLALLHSVWRLHGTASMMPTDWQLIRPPWDGSGSDFKTRSGENATAIIAPETMDTLIVWARRFIREFAPDILAARDTAEAWVASMPKEVRSVGSRADGRHTRGKSPSREPVRNFLNEYIRQNNGLMPATYASNKPDPTVAGLYLAARFGLPDTVREVLREEFKGRYTLSDSTFASVETPIHGRIENQLWTDHIDFYDVAMKRANDGLPLLLQHLRTACLIAATYFTGMRPSEVLTIKRGAVSELPADPKHPEGINGFIVAGTLRKGQRTRDGQADLEGAPRDWDTIRLGADAIRLAETITPSEPFVFGLNSGPISISAANNHVTMFTDFVNNLVSQLNLSPGHAIPPDPAGFVNMTRFRRSISPHIENQPESEFALANQLKHLDPSLSRDGYAATASAGERRQMTRDAANARLKTLLVVEELLTQGGGLSGPSASRLIAATAAAAPLQAAYLSDAEAKRIVSDPRLQVYDNPGQYSLCVYRAATALCSTDDSPDRGACSKACSNHAHTDAQIDVLRQEEIRHRAEADSPIAPKPVRLRLLRRADIEREQIQRHERERIVVSPPNAAKAKESEVI